MSPQFSQTDIECINTIRVLAVDSTTKSKSGHPGAPMGMAPMAHTLFNYYMKFSPKNPNWVNRDRFVLSNGHACLLQYILLHLFGYDYSIDDLKNFRQYGSKTPGHPEAELPGVEVTTGPLGQGITNAVGLAMAQAHLADTFNKPNFELFNNFTYCFLGDGCLQEGVASEAMSLAGHLQLGKLIAFYDDNHISIDGDTNCSFTEDVNKRMEAYGWHVQFVADGDSDLAGIAAAIEKAKQVTDKPSIIRVRTTIGYGSLLQGTHSVHGNPLKPDDAKHVKALFNFDTEKSFYVSDKVNSFYKTKIEQGAKDEQAWNELFASYKAKYPNEAAELSRRINNELPAGWEKALPTYTPEDKALATRKLSENVLNAISETVPELFGGSADLTGSNLTRWNNAVDFQPPATNLGVYAGRYVRYGVREHAMIGIMNGVAAFGGIIPFGGTFLNFVSYGAGSLRLSALSGHRVILVATHDSIGLGEDGPTHQPIETLAHFRAIPNMMVWRPADGNEVSAAYKVAIESHETPSVLALSRQNTPNLAGSSIEKAVKGGYVVYGESSNPDLIFASTGTEVALSIEAAKLLEKEGKTVNVVSLPDFYTFDAQPIEYKLSVFPDGTPVMSVEVLTQLGWHKYAHEYHNIDHFGASGTQDVLYKLFGFTPEGIAERGKKVLDRYKDSKVVSRVHPPAFHSAIQHGPGPMSGSLKA